MQNKKDKRQLNRNDLEINLKQDIPKLGILLSEVQIEKLLDYLILLNKWNSTYNLTAVREPEAMLTYHLLDSLAVVPFLSKVKNLLDVGSGGGLPGLILAIVYPELLISLIDIVHKKTAFLNQIRIELGLSNVSVFTGRVEEFDQNGKFDAIISRAFSSLSDFVKLSGHLLSNQGKFYAMKGLIPSDEINNLDSNWSVERIESLKIPRLDAQRHLLVVRKK